MPFSAPSCRFPARADGPTPQQGQRGGMELSRFLSVGRILVAPVAAIAVLTILLESGRAQTAPDALTAADLQRQLDQRDAIIADLLRRVLELESRVGAGSAAPASAVPAALGEPA